jgi:hypothetical protein
VAWTTSRTEAHPLSRALPFRFEQGHQAHGSKGAIGVPVDVSYDAFLDESVLQIGAMSPFVVFEYEQFDAMRAQVVEADFQERLQQARSSAAPGMLDGDAAEPEALMLASDILQDCKSCNIGFLSRQIISAGWVFDRSGMLRGLPSADEARVALAALDAHHGRDVGFGRGFDFHILIAMHAVSG